MKTNKEKNLEHDAKASAKIRPKQPVYDFIALEAVMKQWVTMNEQTWTLQSSIRSVRSCE